MIASRGFVSPSVPAVHPVDSVNPVKRKLLLFVAQSCFSDRINRINRIKKSYREGRSLRSHFSAAHPAQD
jgi:hypothetical protein